MFYYLIQNIVPTPVSCYNLKRSNMQNHHKKRKTKRVGVLLNWQNNFTMGQALPSIPGTAILVDK